MLCKDPKDRATVKDLIQDRWLTKEMRHPIDIFEPTFDAATGEQGEDTRSGYKMSSEDDSDSDSIKRLESVSEEAGCEESVSASSVEQSTPVKK